MFMEFAGLNVLDTTTSLSIETGTGTAAYLFDRTPVKQYSSVGKNADATPASITINFSVTETVDRVILQNINWKGFRIYYNGNVKNVLQLSSGNITTTSEFSSNSVTNCFFHFSATVMTSITFVPTSTMIANQEKKVGQIWVMTKEMTFEKNPTSDQYKPSFFSKQIVHELSDGGTSILNISSKFKADIELGFVSNSFRDSLQDIYDVQPNVFIPFPTGTGWDGLIYECNWVGDWDFYQPSKNDVRTYGWKGSVKLRETPV